MKIEDGGKIVTMARQKKYTPSASEKRRIRRQQVLFASLAAIMILAMVISLIRF